MLVSLLPNLQPADASLAMKNLCAKTYFISKSRKNKSHRVGSTRVTLAYNDFCLLHPLQNFTKYFIDFTHISLTVFRLFFSSLSLPSQVLLLLSATVGTSKSHSRDCVDVLFRFCHLLKHFAHNKHEPTKISTLSVLQLLPVCFRKSKAIFFLKFPHWDFR